jgi:hypothetical protein
MVYSEVVKNGWILPYKKKYTMSDFNKLHKNHDALTARFIIWCSGAYHNTDAHPCDVSKALCDVNKFKFMD